MINLVRMNLYKMIKSKSTWIILIVATMFSIFSMIMGSIDGNIQSNESGNKVIIEEERAEMNIGIYVNTPYNEDGTQPDLMEYVEADLQSGILMIFITIFTALFVYSEQGSGFIKNISNIKKYKFYYYIAKIVPVMLFTLVMMLSYGISQIITGKILYQGAALGLTLDRLSYIGTQFILLIAFSCFISFLVTLGKNSTLGIVGGLLFATGTGYLLTSLFNTLINKDGFDINKYLVVSNINGLLPGSSSEILIKALLLGGTWIFIWIVLSSALVEKREVL